jgi:subtilisin family serine protease
VAKSFNVAAGGASGMLLYNPVLQGLATDNHFIPAVHLENDDGAALLSFLASHTGVTATFTAGTAADGQGDVMAAFSSRGGPGQVLGISKPDVTAPGVQILAGHTPQPHLVDGGLPGELFQAIQGTSMSSPHVAGAAALIKALRPAWTPGQIKSALMTTAKTAEVFKEDGLTAVDPFDAGSGRIDLNKAGDAGLTFTASDQDYLTLKHTLWRANYPSLYVPALSGVIRVPRTVHSELSRPSLWRVEVVSPVDLLVTTPTFLFVLPGGNKTFMITVDATAVPSGAVRHATLHLTRRELQLTLPITIVRQ